MSRSLCRVNSSEVSHSAASVVGGVAVQQLSPESARSNSQAIGQSRHRRKIAHHHDPAFRRLPFSQKGNCAVLAVVAVNPLETGRVRIELVQSLILPINPV